MSDTDSRMDVIRVLVADNSPIHTLLLADTLKRDSQFEVTPFASDPQNLVAAIQEFDADVLVLGASPEQNAPSMSMLLPQLRIAGADVKAIFLLDSLKDDVVLGAFRAGARGIFGKNQPVEALSKCIRCVHAGQIWANSREMSVALEALVRTPSRSSLNHLESSKLSKRELEVVYCLRQGLTNREIADRLKLSPHTVKNHLFKAFDKLGISSRRELLFLSDETFVNDRVESATSGDLAMLQKQADAGLQAAQLALTNMRVWRPADPKDAVNSWYRGALKKASQITERLTKMLSASQTEESKNEMGTEPFPR